MERRDRRPRSGRARRRSAHACRPSSRPDVVRGVAGDVADADHRAALVVVDRRARSARPRRQQREHARTVAATEIGRLPARRVRALSSPSTSSPRSLWFRRRSHCFERRAASSSIITSDAAVEGYEGWGGYGSSKAALEQMSNVLAAEEPMCGCTGSTPATCAPRCTRQRSPAKTSPTDHSPITVVPALRRLLTETLLRAAGTGRPSCRRSTT